MEWNEFITDSEVSRFGESPTPGKYLFGIVLHDSLDCLNKFITYAELSFTMKHDHRDIQNWFSKWYPEAKNWITRLSEFWKKYHEETPLSDLVWKKLIAEAGTILGETPQIVFEIKDIKLPREEEVKFIFDGAVNSISCLDTIRQDIYSHEYLSLWHRSGKDSSRPL